MNRWHIDMQKNYQETALVISCFDIILYSILPIFRKPFPEARVGTLDIFYKEFSLGYLPLIFLPALWSRKHKF